MSRTRTIAAALVLIGLAAPASAKDPADYEGPFPTTALYDMCSKKDQVSREKCALYLQGLVYGLRVQKQMTDKNMAACLPDLTPEQARRKVTAFIDEVTGGRPANNRDAGDWVAFMALAKDNLCDKRR
jgi:hypothetical protein